MAVEEAERVQRIPAQIVVNLPTCPQHPTPIQSSSARPADLQHALAELKRGTEEGC
jgi:hypothetical protein